MSLEDIASLVAAWPIGECQSLQGRPRAFLAGRIGQVREQLAELRAFEGQLQAVLDRLSARDPGLAPGNAAPGTGPWGGSLDRDALASRTSQWHALTAAATSAERGSGTARFTLPAGPDTAATVTALCAAETTAVVAYDGELLVSLTTQAGSPLAGGFRVTRPSAVAMRLMTLSSWSAAPVRQQSAGG